MGSNQYTIKKKEFIERCIKCGKSRRKATNTHNLCPKCYQDFQQSAKYKNQYTFIERCAKCGKSRRRATNPYNLCAKCNWDTFHRNKKKGDKK